MSGGDNKGFSDDGDKNFERMSSDSIDDVCWDERIKKQNKAEWKKMTKEVERVKDKERAKYMFAVFGVKYDDSQTICVLRQRLAVIALERKVNPVMF